MVKFILVILLMFLEPLAWTCDLLHLGFTLLRSEYFIKDSQEKDFSQLMDDSYSRLINFYGEVLPQSENIEARQLILQIKDSQEKNFLPFMDDSSVFCAREINNKTSPLAENIEPLQLILQKSSFSLFLNYSESDDYIKVELDYRYGQIVVSLTYLATIHFIKGNLNKFRNGRAVKFQIDETHEQYMHVHCKHDRETIEVCWSSKEQCDYLSYKPHRIIIEGTIEGIKDKLVFSFAEKKVLSDIKRSRRY